MSKSETRKPHVSPPKQGSVSLNSLQTPARSFRFMDTNEALCFRWLSFMTLRPILSFDFWLSFTTLNAVLYFDFGSFGFDLETS